MQGISSNFNAFNHNTALENNLQQTAKNPKAPSDLVSTLSARNFATARDSKIPLSGTVGGLRGGSDGASSSGASSSGGKSLEKQLAKAEKHLQYYKDNTVHWKDSLRMLKSMKDKNGVQICLDNININNGKIREFTQKVADLKKQINS